MTKAARGLSLVCHLWQVHCARLSTAAAALLGVDEVDVVESALILKESGDLMTKWHQDRTTLPIDTDLVVTVSPYK